MEQLERLYAHLAPLGLYALHSGGYVDSELAAYAVGLDRVRQAIETLKKQAFVQTASGEGLAMHERLVGLLVRNGSDLAARRELVLYRLAVAPFDFNRAGMIGSIRAAGMDADIEEDTENERLRILYKRLLDDFLDMDSLRARLDTMLPAHLETEFDIGVCTWEMLEAAGVTWDIWDNADFTWDEFDVDGHTILLGGGADAEQQ